MSNTTAQRDPNELLDREQIAREYRIAVPTQALWFAKNRYGWRNVTFKVGSRVLARRRCIEAWLETRRGVVA